MTLPSAFLSLLIASSLAFAFHLWRGGRIARLFLFLLTSWVAFFTGHFVGDWLAWRAWRLGSLNLFSAVLATLIGLVAAQILVRPETGRRPDSSRDVEEYD
jgi:hypothetical protein